MFEYEVIPVVVTRGAGGSEAGQEWAALRTELNHHGRIGFRVVAVSDGSEGRAIVMERRVDGVVEQPARDAAERAGHD